MKKQPLFAGAVFVSIVAVITGLYYFNLSPKGTTTESREEILNATLSTGTNWAIATETEIEGYIICAAYSTDDKVSLAIFDENGGYMFQSSTNRNSEEIIVSNVFIDQEIYDLVWFNGARTEYAELLYTVGKSTTKDSKI